MSNKGKIPPGYTIKRIYDTSGKPFDVLVPINNNGKKPSKKSLVFRGIGMGFKAFLYGVLVLPPFFAAMGFVAIGFSANVPFLTAIGIAIIVAEVGFIVFRRRIARFISAKIHSGISKLKEAVKTKRG